MAGDKYIYNNAGTLTEKAAVQTSAGAGNSGNIPALNSSGVLDNTFMPPGIVPATVSVVSSENLSAGNLVNIYNNAGTANVRKADATTAGKEAHGFVIAATTSPAAATVYFSDNNASITGATPGTQYLSTTAGGITTTAPSASGNVVQRVGFASSATNLSFLYSDPYVLA